MKTLTFEMLNQSQRDFAIKTETKKFLEAANVLGCYPFDAELKHIKQQAFDHCPYAANTLHYCNEDFRKHVYEKVLETLKTKQFLTIEIHDNLKIIYENKYADMEN